MSNFNKSEGRCTTLQRWLACGLAAMFLAVAGIAHASEAGEKPATVTLTVERAPLATVLKKIEAQTYYTFFFNNELVGKAAPGHAFREAGSGSRRAGEDFCRKRSYLRVSGG